MFLYRALLFCFLFCCCLGGHSLNRYLKYYEHISYDEDNLMYHHYRVQRSMQGPREVELNFVAFDKKFNLRLYPDHSYLHKDVRIIRDSVPVSQSSLRSLLYSGYDIHDPTVTVTGHLAFGTFDGTVRTSDELYYIEPSSRYLAPSESSSHSIIYRHSDVDTSILQAKGSTPCGATTLSQQRKLATLQYNSHPRLSKRQGSTRNTSLTRCTLKVIADHDFYNEVSNSGDSVMARTNQVVAFLRNLISTGSTIFETTDFDGQSGPDGIHFVVLEFVVNTMAPSAGSPFADEFLGVEAYLNRHSEENYNAFCLSYAFTNRDFDGGVLGLAFVGTARAQNGQVSAGICARFNNGRTRNTGIVTIINFGRRVPTATSALTFTHEAGHNFGSNHDPAATPSCVPSNADGGKYVMFASANDGSLPNNNRFSPCSRREMLAVIVANEDVCFLTRDDNCRNNLLDEGEDCDCGRSFNTATGICDSDRCCNGTTCRLVSSPGVVCSPQQGPCCNNTCTFITEESDFICSETTECAFNQTCNGTSASCPAAVPMEPVNNTAIPCMGGSFFCVNGECSGSICVPLGLRDCECSTTNLKCHVCCVTSEGCNSTQTIANNNATARSLLPNGQGQFLQVGFPCNNFTGYCDFLNMCQPVQSEGALNRITNFTSEQIRSIVNFLMMYWWATIIGAVVVLVVLFGIVLACHCLLPRPEHMKKRGERRKSLRRSYSQRRSRRRIERDHPMVGYDAPPVAGGYQPYNPVDPAYQHHF